MTGLFGFIWSPLIYLLITAFLFHKLQKTGDALIYSFHPVTGLVVDGTPANGQILNYKVLNAVVLTQVDDHFLRPLLLLDSNKQVFCCVFSVVMSVLHSSPAFYMV